MPGLPHLLEQIADVRLAGSRTDGLVIRPSEGGLWSVQAHELQVTGQSLACDDADFSVERILVHRLAASYRPGDRMPCGVAADEVVLEGVELALRGLGPDRAPGADGPPEAAAPGRHDKAGASQAAATEWHLAPLRALEGRLRACITDAAWILDADISAVLQGGTVDFDQVTVEHVGPDSQMGISRGGIYLDAPHLGRRYLYLFTGYDVPGARFERRDGGRVSDRGLLDVARLAEALLRREVPGGIGRPTGDDVQSILERTQLKGELHLGDGPLGTPRLQAVLAGQAHGRNRISVWSESLARRLVMGITELMASELRFVLAGQPGTAAAVSGELHLKLKLPAPGLGAARDEPALACSVPRLVVQQPRWGEVTFFRAAS